MKKRTWKDWARKALEPGPECPDDERLRLWIEREGTDGAGPGRDGLRDHLVGCALCRLEVDEIRAFFGVRSPNAQEERAAEAIERSLREPLASGAGSGSAPGSRPVVRRGSRLASFGPNWALATGLASAGVVLVVVLVLVWANPEPTVPSLAGGAGELRGGAQPVRLAPTGEQPGRPRRFSWHPEPGAPGPWVFRLERVDGRLLWSATTSSPEVELPESIADALQPGSRYSWHVAAVDRPSSRASASFRVAPNARHPREEK